MLASAASNPEASSNPRLRRGLALFETKGNTIKAIVAAKYLVPSVTGAGGYVVDATAGTCTCPDWESLGGHGRGHRCKHLLAVLLLRREIVRPDGNAVVIEQKVQYPRDWRATNKARTEIPRLGPTLLADLIPLCQGSCRLRRVAA